MTVDHSAGNLTALAVGAGHGPKSTPAWSPRALLSTVSSWHRPLVWFTAVTAVWAVVAAVGLVADPRTLAGDPIWAKPLKFSVSLSVYALTLAWMLSLVHRPRLRRVGWWAGSIGAVASLLEITVISVQVVRGTGSHFNVATPLDSALYALMGGGVVLMYTATLVIGAALAVFTHLPDRALAWALRLGVIIALAGLSVGFLMVVPRAQQLAQPEPAVLGSHSVGGEAPGGLFFLGWSTTHGDLRVAHFIGMHALQALPLLALALAALTTGFLSHGTRLRVVLLAAEAWASVTALSLWQALRGQSVLHPDSWTWSVAGVLLLIGCLSAAGTLQYHRRHPVEVEVRKAAERVAA